MCRRQRLFSGDQQVERLPWLGHVTDAGRQVADVLARMSGGENHGKVWPARFQLARQIDPVHDAAQPNVGEDQDDLPPTDQHDGKRSYRAFTLVSSCSSSIGDAARLRCAAWY